MDVKIFRPMPFALMVSSPCRSEGRSIPGRTPVTQSLKINFNGESVRAYYLLLDARTSSERQEDRNSGSLKGPVIVFFQGHAQRPSDAYAFTSKLALLSRSGIVVVPVCDTPYGIEDEWRGDSGKDVILMDVIRRALARSGISVSGYAHLSGRQARMDGGGIDEAKCALSADLIEVGWSHGGILARRFAHAYPDSVSGLGQVCPAGYEKQGPLHLAGRFALESLRISKITTSAGQAREALSSAWGFTKGVVGDFARSLPGAAVQAQPSKILRVARDIKDCSLNVDGTLFGLGPIERIVVIFGEGDTCMNPKRILGLSDLGTIPEKTREEFRRRFFADTLSHDAEFSLEVLPGTHLAPVTHSDLYARTLLDRLGQLAGS